MKNKFWVHSFGSLFVYPFYLILSTAIFITGIILSITNDEFISLMIIGILFFIFGIIMTIFNKDIFSKVIFTDQNIKIEKFGKSLKNIKWQDIYEVKGSYIGRSTACLIFISKNDSIRIVPTKVMYHYILSIAQEMT